MDNEVLLYIFMVVVLVVVMILVILDNEVEEKCTKKEERQKTPEEIEEELFNSIPDDSNYYYEVKNCKYPVVKKLKNYIPNKKVKVLIGDYMPSSICNTISVLESMGIVVDVTKSGVGIIKRIKTGEKYDIIITNNIYNKGYMGLETMQRLRKIDGFSSPIIVLTISKGQRDEFIVDGFDDYMEKALTQEQVLNIFPKHITGLEFKNIK